MIGFTGFFVAVWMETWTPNQVTPMMYDQPKQRVKGWQEQMMDRVFDHCKVGKYEMTSDTSIQVSTPNNPTLGDLRVYKSEIQIALDTLENEKIDVGNYIPNEWPYGSESSWMNEFHHRQAICTSHIRQIKPILYKIDAAIDMKIDEERRAAVQPKQNEQQLALDF
jgi:hypothetical protein